jgi:hypothetical protein
LGSIGRYSLDHDHKAAHLEETADDGQPDGDCAHTALVWMPVRKARLAFRVYGTPWWLPTRRASSCGSTIPHYGGGSSPQPLCAARVLRSSISRASSPFGGEPGAAARCAWQSKSPMRALDDRIPRLRLFSLVRARRVPPRRRSGRPHRPHPRAAQVRGPLQSTSERRRRAPLVSAPRPGVLGLPALSRLWDAPLPPSCSARVRDDG